MKAHKNAMTSSEKRKEVVECIQEVMATITRAARKIVHERNPNIFSDNPDTNDNGKASTSGNGSKTASANAAMGTGNILSMLRKSNGSADTSDNSNQEVRKEPLAGLAKKNKAIPEQLFMGAIRCGNCIMRLLCEGSMMKEIAVILCKVSTFN